MKGLINAGIDQPGPIEASKIKLTNLVGLITCGLALTYSAFYFYSLDQAHLAFKNLGFVFAYGVTIFWSYRRLYWLAKVWFFCTMMLQVFVLTTYVFNVASGFHFYYLILPPGVFLLFDYKEHWTKFTLCLVGTILFFVCEIVDNPSPLIKLDSSNEKIISASVIIVTMSEVYLIMTLLGLNIESHEKALNALATTDALTGINNRHMFMMVGQELIENSRRYQRPLTLLLFDIDHFKKVNDTYGHLVGDQALKQFAFVLQSNIRASDLLARFGGEEFVVILPETGIKEATELAQNLRKAISQIRIDVKLEEPLSINTSIGLARYRDDMESLIQLLDDADKALYQAKDSGRNQVVAYGVGTGAVY